MERKKYLIIMAGGKGLRMGSELPKQFIKIGGRAILQISISKFLEAVPDIRVVTVLPQSHMLWWRDYCMENDFVCPQTFVPGGITRFHSVLNALGKVPDGAVVAVHDGVRPLISVEGIRRLFAEAETSPAVIPVVPVTDTLKALRRIASQNEGDGCSVGAGNAGTLRVGTESEIAVTGRMELMEGVSVDRSMLYAAQTPQIFHSEVLKEAYRQPFDTHFTDDASVLEAKRIPLSYVEGERFNIKITTKEDLEMARAMLAVNVSV